MKSNTIQPLISHFYHWEKEKADEVFLRQPYGRTWKELTWRQAGAEARRIASALQDMGLGHGDHIGIYSKNCYHWILADLAIMMIGAVSVPFYASLPRQQLAQVVELSDIKAIFVGKLDKWGDRAEAIPEGVQLIRFPHYEGNAPVELGRAWDELLAKYEPIVGEPAPHIDDLWTIKFTSGTTGTPKGVMHVHRSPVQTMITEYETDFIGLSRIDHIKCFSFLPLNHVGERMGVEVPCLYAGGTISFAENLDTFVDNLKDTQPTLFFAVPRIWTKFYQGVIAKLPQKRLELLLRIPVVSGLVKKKILNELGLGAVQIAATGAAITPEYLKKWYSKLGIHLIEAYGMTEVCGSMTNSPMQDAPPDSVGVPVPNGDVRIDLDTSEILMSSPYMMKGYYKNPEKTAEVLKDGWLHSGDRGTIDERGFVRVIGRVKDAFKTSKGSYITPNPMEEIIANNPYVEQCCVAGLGIPQPICIVNLSEAAKTADKQAVATSLEESRQLLNHDLANYQKVSTIIIDEDIWSESNKLLTPTMKVRRGALDEKYGKHYLAWNDAKESILWKA